MADIFEIPVTSEEELALIADRLGTPEVVKYLRALAYDAAVQIAQEVPMSQGGGADVCVDYTIKSSFIKGSLAILMQLIDTAKEPE